MSSSALCLSLPSAALGDSISDLRVRTGWRRGPAADSAGPFLLSYTEFTPDTLRDIPGIYRAAQRLRREIAELEESKRQLESGAQGREAAVAEARRRAEVLGILAGTLPAEGPGLEVVFAPRDQRIRADSVLDAVEELRGAGAEALQISGATGDPVRIVAASYFVDSGDGITVDGVPMSSPYTIEVIGDPATMQTALNIPGGVVDAVRQHGGNVTMRQPDLVRVTALHTGGPLRYARPVS